MLIEVGDIARMLAGRIEALCAEILPGGHREGAEWVEARRANGGLGDGLRVRLHGARAGVWKHFADAGSGGDALDLVAYVMFAGDKRKAIEWAKAYLGLRGADKAALQTAKKRAVAASKEAFEKDRADREKRRKYAHAMWLGSMAYIRGTPADFYLRGRGIALDHLVKIPSSLRFAVSLRHPSGGEHPAMVAAINNAAGEFVGVHRTYLDTRRAGSGIVTKYAGPGDAKVTLGSYRGGFITLARGASGKPLRDAPEGDGVILCEGIEDGLTLAMACPEYRVLACVSSSNFANIALPPAIGSVIIAADNDPEFITDPAGRPIPHPARRSVQAAVDRFMDEGRAVRVAYAPKGKDFNACHQMAMREDGAA